MENYQGKINDAVALALGQMHIELIAAQVRAQAEADRADRAEATIEEVSGAAKTASPGAVMNTGAAD